MRSCTLILVSYIQFEVSTTHTYALILVSYIQFEVSTTPLNPVLTLYPILCASVPGKGGVYLILQGSVEMISQDSVSKKTSSTVVSCAQLSSSIEVTCCLVTTL